MAWDGDADDWRPNSIKPWKLEVWNGPHKKDTGLFELKSCEHDYNDVRRELWRSEVIATGSYMITHMLCLNRAGEVLAHSKPPGPMAVHSGVIIYNELLLHISTKAPIEGEAGVVFPNTDATPGNIQDKLKEIFPQGFDTPDQEDENDGDE